MLFVAGLVVLYLNPFWHFDDGGFLDWRLRWWNIAGEVLISAGFLIEALALVGLAAVVVSRFAGRRAWPYVVAALLVACTVVWISPAGFTVRIWMRTSSGTWPTASTSSACKCGTESRGGLASGGK